MKRKFGLLVAVMAMLASITTTAYAETTNTNGDVSLTVNITSPSDGQSVEPGSTVEVEGTVSLEQAPVAENTDVVFVLDTSGSTGVVTTGLGCDGDQRILDCETGAVRQLLGPNGAASDFSEIGRAGITNFPNADPQFTCPEPTSVELLDVDNEPAEFGAFLDSLSPCGGTNFERGIQSALGILDGTTNRRVIVLLTDGRATGDLGGAVLSQLGNTRVLAFAIGGTSCAGNDPTLTNLQQIVASAGEGSVCVSNVSLESLTETIVSTFNVFPAAITDFEFSVDGVGDPSIELTEPASGVASFSGEITLGEAQDVELCATATASLGGNNTLETSDCVTVSTLPPNAVVVDCAGAEGSCEATATDEGVATLEFEAPAAFDEEVVIVPTTEDCPVANCRTGFDVTFEDENTKGDPDRIVTLTVTTENRVRFRDRLRAAVYIDDQRITAQCNNRFLVRALRDRWGRPEPLPCITIRYVRGLRLEYFVKFDADPRFRFR